MALAIKPQGSSGVVAEVEANTLAIRTVMYPPDVLGSYSLLVTSGSLPTLTGLNAVFAARWTDPTRFCLINKITVAVNSTGTGFTAGLGHMSLWWVRAITASATGGTAVVLTGDNNKRRTSFCSSLFTDMRIASTAALTSGTWATDNTEETSRVTFQVTTATNTLFLPTTQLWSPDMAGEWPLVLGKDDGFIILPSFPATGTWQFDLGLEWSEVVNF